MKYALMIYGDETADAKMSPAERQQEMGAYFGFSKEIREKDVYRGGEALHPVSTATTVRVQGGKVLTTDGPFAETKEQLGGFYLVECKDLDEAIHWASKIPHASKACVEIRPVIDFSNQPRA